MAERTAAAFAEIDIPAPILNGLELLGLVVGLIVLIALGYSIVKRTRDWTKTDDGPPEHSLAEYEAMLERGDIDRQEFERIVARLKRRPPQPPAGS